MLAAAPRSERTDITLPLRGFVAASGLRSIVLGASKDPNAKITVLLVSPEGARGVLAIKAPTTDAAARAVAAEAEVLEELSLLHLAELEDTVPRVVDWTDFDGRRALVTTAVPGKAMTTTYLGWRHIASADRVSSDFDAVGRWLRAFQTATATDAAPVEMDAAVGSKLRARFGTDEVEEDLERLTAIHARLRRERVPRTAVHGDFWFGNILLQDGEVSGVVDWEAGAAEDEPVRDLVRFALMYSLYLDRRTTPNRRVRGHRGLRAGDWGAGVEYALDGTGWYPDLVRGFVAGGLARLGASPSRWRDALVAGIAEVAALTDEDEFARRHLELFRRVSRTQRMVLDE
jgi:aminoglycoside phosphotransferase